MTSLNVSGIIYESMVDGPGLRTVLFTQGCPHHCPGCHNMSTWAYKKNQIHDTQELGRLLIEQTPSKALTFSGGEPFVQAKACSEIAVLLREEGFNLWSYTGYNWEDLISLHNRDISRFLSQLDVVVDGRFILSKKTMTVPFRGSSNQRLIDVQSSLERNQTVLYEISSQKPAAGPTLYI